MSGNAATRFEEMVAAYSGDTRRSPYADYFADPYRFFAWARAEAPVLHLPEIDWWAVARFHDITSVFRDPETFSSTIVNQPMAPPCPRAAEIVESAGMRMEPALVAEEPPSHPRNRRIFGKGFAVHRVARFEPRIRETISCHIDGFADDGRADLLAQLLHPVTNRMLFHLLGGADDEFDPADWPSGMSRIQAWGPSTEAAQVSLAQMMARMWSFGARLVEAAIENPGESYLGDLVRQRRADPSLFTDNYLRSIAFVLQVAGSSSQSHALANGVRAMLVDRAPWEKLCADPDLIPNAVEEVLRFGMPILTFPRLATRDAEIGGRHIPAGARILLLIASGNRDESVFPDGEVLDVERKNARDHLSFGVGSHFCLGAPLARLQMKIVLEELTARLPRMRLADGGVADIYRTLTFRGLNRLPVEWG